MASKRSEVCLMLVVILATASTWGSTEAQTSISSSCTSVLLTMSSCLNYITGNSSSPAASCCSSLSNVVQSQPQCLCSALNSGAASTLGVAVNQTRALQLPGVCNVQTPPMSQCSTGGGGGPSTAAAADAPADSPAGVPDEEPESPTSDFPSGSGSKTVPSTGGGDSNGSNTISSSLHLVFMFSAVFASAVAMF